jgi:hypothetical protein
VPGESLDIDALAHDLSQLPEQFQGSPAQIAATLLDFFSDSKQSTGGAIEVVDETVDDDGVIHTAEHAALDP